MSSRSPETDPLNRWVPAALAGGIAGVLFSVVAMPAEMMPNVAALYSLEGVVWGWVSISFTAWSSASPSLS